jgi:thioredoxin 1
MLPFKELINSERPVLVDFFAEWCGPCKVLAPILVKIKAELGDKLSVVKIDVDSNPSVSNAYNVNGVPTLILFKKGRILWREAGAVPFEQLLSRLRPHI